jgi:uncharacterized lipoprotein NlpE involved in copper resistance
MKHKTLLTGILGIMLVFGMVLIGCDNGSTDDGGGSEYGSITIKNNSNTYKITYFEVTDVDSNLATYFENVSIEKGGSKSFGGIEPGDKLRVYIEDDDGYYYNSPQFSLKAGGSKTFTYDGLSLK